MRKPPCKINGVDCPKRHPGCHSGCKDYAEFDAENQKERAQRMQERISSAPSPKQKIEGEALRGTKDERRTQIMTCKECLYEKLCPFNISSTEAERCKTYDPKADYVKVVRCKDCTHRDRGWCKVQARYAGDSEYCSLGITKEATSET